MHTYLRTYRNADVTPSVTGALGMAALAPVRELPGAQGSTQGKTAPLLPKGRIPAPHQIYPDTTKDP